MCFIVALIFVVIFIKIIAKLTCGRCTSPVCLVGKTALITGGNSGVGYHTALALAGRGCRVIIADKDNCDKSKQKIIEDTGNSNIVTKHFDLASLKSVRQLAKDINENEERLDILINNAVAVGLGNSYTEDELHIGMHVNHFGHFLLTHILVGLLKKSKSSRIIFVTSVDAYLSNLSTKNLNFPKTSQTLFSEFMVYSNSKLCNIITANEFATKLKGKGVTANSVHPGLVHTPLFRNTFEGLPCHNWQKKIMYFLYLCILKPFAKAPEEAADAVLHTAIDKELEDVTGKFFADCRTFLMPPRAKDGSFIRKIWKASENFVKLAPNERL